MNLNDEDVDLGLALGSTYYSVRTRRLDSSSGAGVNADARVDMTFAASDPLSELVWSPHNGLSLKCADPSLPNKKLFNLWNVGLSMKDPSTLQISRSKEGSGDKKAVEEKFGDIAPMLRSSVGNSNSGADAILEGITRHNQEEGPSSRHFADIAECSKRNAEQDTLADDAELVAASSNEIIGETVRLNSEPHSEKLCEGPNCSLPKLVSQQELDNEVTSSSQEIDANKISNHLMILESSAENDLCRMAAKEVHSPVERSTDNRINLYHEKGKAKALSDGDIYARSDDEDDSNESMESCNSIGLFSKGLKRQRYDGEKQFTGSKRSKRQMLASRDSPLLAPPDSSFMNWISNMVKGLSDSNKEGSSSLCLTLARSNEACESPKPGFQSMFQSLYCRNTKLPIVGINKDTCCSIEESKEPTVAAKKPLENVAQDQNVSRNTEFSAPFDNNARDKAVDTPLPIRYIPSKSSPLSSLWITRLYNKSVDLENCDQVVEETPACSTELTKPSVSSTHKPSLAQFPHKLRTSDAMASIFAKRLDAFRNVTRATGQMKSSLTSAQICFFCGSSSHDLRICPELTEAELDDLLVKVSAFDRVDVSPSFCIKCFQFDHWASSCSASHQHKVRTSCLVQLLPVNDDRDRDDHKLAYSECRRNTATNNIRRFPQFNFHSAAQNADTAAEGEALHAIIKLRLSRGDVIRWMNSNESLSRLNGYFLRVRLGSSDAGLTGTGYYAARITGNTIERIGHKSKKTILVDVGGIQSSVGSQYVSNHDFLEDEVKAWWSRVVNTGSSIPSLAELNSKFNERKCLGF
ncbi:uncharacterized protein LOC127249097 isoform X2 [Andrographis paniculata]|uniref:uncharacterized protein LOC127249097 isoform X2 n=1 Tax=Andrographis paniculata TaxID=175694 RepID=UPI0021E70E5B|nr:uncharacterized protein LOC127249097 isoform X2 [Andrographis paniculata]